MDQIYLREARNEVDKKYVGFAPNGGSIKPVHIAGGSLRCIYGYYNRTKSIKRMALVSDAKGNTPKGNELETVYKELLSLDKIEDSIPESAVDSLRNVMQRLLSADKGVYVTKDLKDGMTSYSAGSKFFLTSKAMYEDAGEFIGSIVHNYCPELAKYISELLDASNDPITILFEPILEEDRVVVGDQNKQENLPAFSKPNTNTKWFTNSIREAGNCLLENFRYHSNPLTQLRLFNFFCIFNIVRYMTLLESFYCDEQIRPIMLDFSGKSPSFSSVARMSEMSYTQMYKSINRFYAWGYAEWLKEKGYSKDELLKSTTPMYEKGKTVSKASKDELTALWNLAKERASSLDKNDVFLVFGETMYDMLAIEASSHPVTYIRALGTSAGALYPPDQFHPNKRFVVSQDILEMIIRGCVSPKEIISGFDIRRRLWDRFGIIIGGSQIEMNKLQTSGIILQIDEDALEENFSQFANTLEAMDFAEVMADGILQIKMGGKELC